MRTGVIFLPSRDPAELIERVVRADRLGFDYVGIGDVPDSSGELYVTLGELATLPLGVSLGPMVTSPAVRHPVVTAAATAALARRAPERVFLGVGRGGSPLGHLGVARPATSELGDCVRAMRAGLLRFGARVPVLLSAYGPQTLRLAATGADGVIIAGGASTAYVRTAIETVRRAAPNADGLAIWLMVRVSIGESWAEAVNDIRSNLASAGANNLRGPSLATLPDDLQAALARLRDRYDTASAAHTARDGHNARLIDELGLTEFLAERFAVVGSPDAVRTRFAEYAALGVDAVFVPSVDGDAEGFLERLIAARYDASA